MRSLSFAVALLFLLRIHYGSTEEGDEPCSSASNPTPDCHPSSGECSQNDECLRQLCSRLVELCRKGSNCDARVADCLDITSTYRNEATRKRSPIDRNSYLLMQLHPVLNKAFDPNPMNVPTRYRRIGIRLGSEFLGKRSGGEDGEEAEAEEVVLRRGKRFSGNEFLGNAEMVKRNVEMLGKRGVELLGKRSTELLGKRGTQFLQKRSTELLGKRGTEFLGKRGTELLGKRSTELLGKRGTEFLGKRGTEFLGKRGTEFLGKRSTELLGKRGTEFLGKRGTELLGKRSTELLGKRGTEFLGKRGTEFLGKRGTEFLGKRSTELLGKRGTELLGKRGTEFLGKRNGIRMWTCTDGGDCYMKQLPSDPRRLVQYFKVAAEQDPDNTDDGYSRRNSRPDRFQPTQLNRNPVYFLEKL